MKVEPWVLRYLYDRKLEAYHAGMDYDIETDTFVPYGRLKPVAKDIDYMPEDHQGWDLTDEERAYYERTKA